MSRARRALWCAVAVLAVLPASARAEAVSGAQLRALAARAADDPGAQAELRRVDRVDGRRVDIGGALGRARGGDLRARLRALQAPAPAAAAGDPRADARAILSEGRFQHARVPGPFRGLLDRLGRALPSLQPVIDRLDDLLPGGRSVVWICLAALVATAAALGARRLLTRRVRASTAAAAAAPDREDARALERRADAAEAAGDLEAALRLRFRAGLLRLDARGAIAFRPSLSTHEVRRVLRSEDFDELAATFDEVVYGRRPPDGRDLSAARERWSRVVAAAREKVAA